MFISLTNDKANQKTGIKKNEKGIRSNCIVDLFIKLNISVTYLNRFNGITKRSYNLYNVINLFNIPSIKPAGATHRSLCKPRMGICDAN